MQLEEDLGYVISAETLTQFQKVRHYINYIEQVEGFKKDNHGQAPLSWSVLFCLIVCILDCIYLLSHKTLPIIQKCM